LLVTFEYINDARFHERKKNLISTQCSAHHNTQRRKEREFND